METVAIVVLEDEDGFGPRSAHVEFQIYRIFRPVVWLSETVAGKLCRRSSCVCHSGISVGVRAPSASASSCPAYGWHVLPAGARKCLLPELVSCFARLVSWSLSMGWPTTRRLYAPPFKDFWPQLHCTHGIGSSKSLGALMLLESVFFADVPQPKHLVATRTAPNAWHQTARWTGTALVFFAPGTCTLYVFSVLSPASSCYLLL